MQVIVGTRKEIGTVECETIFFLFGKLKNKATHNYRFKKDLRFKKVSTIWKQVQVIVGTSKVIGTVEV